MNKMNEHLNTEKTHRKEIRQKSEVCNLQKHVQQQTLVSKIQER